MDVGNSVHASQESNGVEVLDSVKDEAVVNDSTSEEIVPTPGKYSSSGSALSKDPCGLTEEDSSCYSDCLGQCHGREMKKRTRSTEKFATPVGENKVELNVAMVERHDERISHLPSYNFSFKCAERAHKRKEFDMKLKERHYAKEIERAITVAKLKEAEDAEIKMLRKSLVIKAKPLPSFYHERSRPKIESEKNPASMPKPPRSGQPKNCSPKTISKEKSCSTSPTSHQSAENKSIQKTCVRGSMRLRLNGPPERSNPLENASAFRQSPRRLGTKQGAGKTQCRDKDSQEILQKFRGKLY